MNGTRSGEMKALVTGGAGFIGSALVRRLAERGMNVVVADTLVNGRRENLDDILGDRVELVEADIRDAAEMRKLMDGVDIVFHLACLGVRHSIHSPVENHDVNAGGTLTLLAEAREREVGRFVYVSSSEVYGTATTVPMKEDHPTFPHTVYGASKLAGDCYARAYWDTYHFPTVVVRPFNSYGPRSHHEGDSGEVIPKFLLRAMAGRPLVIFGDGEQTRDFTYVDDTASGIIAAGMADDAVGKTINIGYGREVTINRLAKLVSEVVDRPDAAIEHVAPRPGDVRRLFADPTSASERLGYAPSIGLREGLERLRDWYLESGETAEDLLTHESVRNWESTVTAGAESDG